MELHPLAYNVPRAVEMIPIGRTKLYEEIAAGRLKSIKVGTRRLVTHQALQDFLTMLAEDASGDQA
jgi:excisionase family DNA binding protein